MQDYEKRHAQAMRETTITSTARNAHETAIVAMFRAWCAYAAAHRRALGSPISEDYYLGPLWEDMGRNLCRMLNGETGRIDCGTLDRSIRETLVANGFTNDF